jgi:hypothetical protein
MSFINYEVTYSCEKRHAVCYAKVYINNMTFVDISKDIPSGLKVGYVKKKCIIMYYQVFSLLATATVLTHTKSHVFVFMCGVRVKNCG